MQKEQQRQQTKNQLKLARKWLQAVKPYFAPQIMFDCIFVEHR